MTSLIIKFYLNFNAYTTILVALLPINSITNTVVYSFSDFKIWKQELRYQRQRTQ